MSAAANPNKPTFQPGDVVHAPFASPNAEGTYSKHRIAYVASVVDDKATLVYISASGKSLEGMRYTGELDKDREGLKKNSFYDAGQTTTVPTDYLIKQTQVSLRQETKDAIERDINRERTEFIDARRMVRDLREKAAALEGTSAGAEKARSADLLVAKNEAAHRHVQIDHEGNVRVNRMEKGWQHHGTVSPETLAEMRRDAARHSPRAEGKPNHEIEVARQAAPAVADDRIQVIKENGATALLGPQKKEQLRASLHDELSKAGHDGEFPDAKKAHKIAIDVATAGEGAQVAIGRDGNHLIVPKGAMAPDGSTVLDAAALRASAKIMESSLMRGVTGPAGSGVEAVMAAGMFFDRASGGALSASPLGKAVEYAGEKTGAFAAVMKAGEVLEPVVDKIKGEVSALAQESGVTPFLARQLAAQTEAMTKFNQETGIDKVLEAAKGGFEDASQKLESLIRENFHGPRNPEHREPQASLTPEGTSTELPAESVRLVVEQVTQAAQDSGMSSFKLTTDEGVALAKELCCAKPGDSLVVEKNGDIYMALAPEGGANAAQSSTQSLTLDADALRESAGLASMGTQREAPREREAEGAQLEMEMEMSAAMA